MQRVNLNYDNFWGEQLNKTPISIKRLYAFIDEYKAEIKWHDLFAVYPEIMVTGTISNFNIGESNRPIVIQSGDTEPVYHRLPDPPKFHDIPLDMQTGIIMRWIFKVTENYPAHRTQLTQGLISSGVELWAIIFNLEWVLKVIEGILSHE